MPPITEDKVREIIQDELRNFIRSDRYTFDKLVQFLDGRNIQFNTATGTKIGTATGEKLAFHNSTPVIQSASGSQDAVTTTGATQSSPWGYSTAAQANAIVTLQNQLRLDLVNKGIIKGSA